MPWIRAVIVLCLLPCLAFGSEPEPEKAAPLVAGNTAFTCDLYGKLKLEEGNLFFSPLSISTALAMTREGAAGQTATQMDAVMHFPRQGLGEAFRALSEALTPSMVRDGYGASAREVPAYELAMANRLWGQQGFAFLPAFEGRLAYVYGAPLERIDFAKSTAARARINGWVEDQTKDRIKDLLPEGVPTTDTRLVLVNAVYFKSAWLHPFSERATKDEPFHLLGGAEVRASMMKKTERFGYAANGDLQILELPYRSGDLSMIVLLPKAKDGLPALEAALTAKALSAWLGAIQYRSKVAVAFPKFTFTKGFDLTNVLAAMGMPDAFSPMQADFSGMTTEQPLYIGFVLHKGFVAVDEKGTEAAAATAVGMRLGAAPAPENPIPFTADHPFLFLIRHRKTGALLFVGRVLDPTK